MKILQIVEESPSLDFSLPIFEFLNDSDEIIVFSTKPNFDQWYEVSPNELLFNNKLVNFSTTIDCLKLPYLVKKFLRILTKNNRDNVNNFFSKALNKIINLFINLFIKPSKYITNKFEGLPDLVFIDTRNDLIPNKVNKDLFNWIDQNNIKTIGIPVSLYTLEGVSWSPITPFGVYELETKPFKGFPKNYEYWLTSKQPYVIDQLGKLDSKIVGYPGVDSKWLSLFNYDHKIQSSNNEINILLNVRHFGKSRNLEKAKGKYIYDDIYNFFKEIKQLIDSCEDVKINLYIKPHYYVNFKSFEKLLNQLNIKNYKFLRTSIYMALKNINFVVGLHSSVNLVSILAGIPTLIFPQILTEKFIDEDEKSSNIYKNLNGYTENIQEFNELFYKYLDPEFREKHIKKDEIHVRSFFQDQTIDNIIKTIKT